MSEELSNEIKNIIDDGVKKGLKEAVRLKEMEDKKKQGHFQSKVSEMAKNARIIK